MVDDIRKQEVITYTRETVFIEPGCFKCDYEEINGVPFFHFVFLTKPTVSLVKMLKLLCQEAEEEVWFAGHDCVYSYTKKEHKSLIKVMKHLGFNVIQEKEDLAILKKEIKIWQK